jgi:hypothetical protein
VSATRASSADASQRLARLGSHLITLAAGLAAALPVIVATVNAVRDHWEPGADQGIIATRAYDVLSSHTPLVGQYTLAGHVTGQVTHGLGPMLYWLLALPARFGTPASLTLTMGAVNTAAVVGSVALARRRGGQVLMVATAVAIAVMCRSLAAETFHDVWNPSAGLFPFTLLIFLCWSLACGEHRLLPLTVLVASFVVQVHLMYLPPTVGLLAIGVVGLALTKRGRLGDRRRTAALGVVTLLAAAACWIAPAIDEIEHHPGNVALVVRSATAPTPTLGAAVGWHATVRAIGYRPWWLHDPADRWSRKDDVRRAVGSVRTATTVALLGALALAVVLGFVRRRRDVSAAAAIGLVLCAALAAEAAHTPVPRVLSATLGYTMWWGSQVGMWVWLVVAWCAWLALTRGVRALAPRARLAAAPAAVSVVALAGAAAAGAAVSRSEKPDEHVAVYRPIAALGTPLTRMFAAGQTVRLDGRLDVSPMPIKPALRYLLVRHGVRVLSRGAFQRLGSYYEVDHRPYDASVYVRDRLGRPVAHATLVARAHYVDGWGPWTVSVWVAASRGATSAYDGRTAWRTNRTTSRFAFTPDGLRLGNGGVAPGQP